jgi:hypothetical protein
MEEDEKPNMVESLYEKTTDYGKTTLELTKLKTLNTIVGVTTVLVSRFSVVIILTLFLLVFNIGLALWIGDMLGELYYGFFIIAALYLLAGIILYYYGPAWLKKPLGAMIIKEALD